MIGSVGNVDRVGDGFQKRLKSAFRLPLFGQFIEFLLGFDDLFGGFKIDIDLGGFGRDVLAQTDQVTADAQIIDHLRIITRGKRRDRRTGKTGQIGGAAQFFQTLVILHKSLERHR